MPGSSTDRDWEVRVGGPDDFDAVLELWRRFGVEPSPTDDAAALRALLEADPRALLLAHSRPGVGARKQLVGAVIAAWNGWRGSLYRLVVHADWRRLGVATSLVRHGERHLRERGARRLDALVTVDDARARSLWESLGYEHQRDRARYVCNVR